MEKVNPVLLEIFKNRFSSICEEMGTTLNRTAYSPNIKERRDFSCAVFNLSGEMIAQAAHIPVHLGSMPMSVKAAIDSTGFEKGDMVMLNDPYKGGTHLPDITMVAPVFHTKNTSSAFYVANRAHHSDVGGMVSGSMPLSTSVFQEGVIIPPLKIIKKGKQDEDLMALFLNNVRTPDEREGDFAAQIVANLTGIKRVEELILKYSLRKINFYASALMDYSEKITRKRILSIPDGKYEFEDFLDDDGIGTENIKIKVVVTIDGEEANLDFTGSDDQVEGSVNAVYSITLSGVIYVFCTLIKENIPFNAGCFRPVTVKTRKGSVVDACFPAPVAGGNVETSQRVVDVVFGALGKALPEIVPAASQGTMNNVAIGGINPENKSVFAYYETIAGGMGATASGAGESAVHSHMTNTLNTPVEALEYSYPFLVTEYSIRKNSGGKGRFSGGDGVVREMKLMADAEITVLSERRKNPPYGLGGGCDGGCGRNIIIRDKKEKIMPGKFHGKFKKGDIVRIETPGGGGFGK